MKFYVIKKNIDTVLKNTFKSDKIKVIDYIYEMGNDDEYEQYHFIYEVNGDKYTRVISFSEILSYVRIYTISDKFDAGEALRKAKDISKELIFNKELVLGEAHLDTYEAYRFIMEMKRLGIELLEFEE